MSGFYRDLEVQGDVAYVLYAYEGLLTVDISDPHAPSVLGALDALDDPWGIAVKGEFVYVADNYSDLRVADVSDPLDPSVIGGPVVGTDGALDVEVEGTLAYATGSRHGSIQVIDVSVPQSPLQRAGYWGDGNGGDDGEVFDGIVYDLGSGRVIDFGPGLRPPREVGVDIDPRHERNRIRLDRPGVVHVAVLGSAEFDAASIDPETLSFGPDAARPIGSDGGISRDVNRDGLDDWLASFRIEETGIAFGDELACIEGESLDGRRFQACDAIVTTYGCGQGFQTALLVAPLVLFWGRSRRKTA